MLNVGSSVNALMAVSNRLDLLGNWTNCKVCIQIKLSGAHTDDPIASKNTHRVTFRFADCTFYRVVRCRSVESDNTKKYFPISEISNWVLHDKTSFGRKFTRLIGACRSSPPSWRRHSPCNSSTKILSHGNEKCNSFFVVVESGTQFEKEVPIPFPCDSVNRQCFSGF